METETRRTLLDRMLGAAKLDVATYEEVEANVALTQQAGLVVLIVAVARGIGSSGHGLGGIFAGVVAALLGWLLWAGLTYLIGDKLLGGTATWGELLRTLGYAQAPGVLAVLGVVGFLSGPVELVVSLWLLATGIVAIRQALDFGTGKAILTAFLGWLVTTVAVLLLGLSVGGMSGVMGG
ncbi:MAG: YIP1 family protein [Gemmatimonadota bacterium]|nr:YIP1 family protein [Gemmatimonadota bacterium]